MALTKGVNSYVSLAEANSYFEDRIDVAAWSEASDTQKSQALVTAASILEILDWAGTAVSDLQALAFPREGSYFDPRLGYPVDFTSTIPDRVIKAQYELAYHLLNNDGLLDDSGGVDNLTIGPIQLTQIKSPSHLPAIVYRQIKPLLSVGRRFWWRAN